jgi:hypothetical protein
MAVQVDVVRKRSAPSPSTLDLKEHEHVVRRRVEGTTIGCGVHRKAEEGTRRYPEFRRGSSTLALAESLVERHAFEMQLRALDALQPAVALELQHAHLMDHFVTADIVLDEVARSEGLAIINPLRD